MSAIESTYKAKETEEWLDIVFYRPIGYYMALSSKALGITPNMITVSGMIAGALGGHLFYYSDIYLIITGVLLLMLSEALDGADGQLARMTNSGSKFGRILDGFATNIIFLSVYVHLALRLSNDMNPYLIWAGAVIAGLSHSLQSAMADYYRNGYVHYIVKPGKSELDNGTNALQEYRSLSWIKNPLKKFLGRLYVNYTLEQEAVSPNFRRLKIVSDEQHNGILPEALAEIYRRHSRPLIKYYNILTTNTRMIFLFFAVLINIPWLYFLFEVIVLNSLLLHVITCQEMTCQLILKKIDEYNLEPAC
ncbi:MAG: CDP-alcohol phosphatidyltransferase family protein [Bacteroidota bacterium]